MNWMLAAVIPLAYGNFDIIPGHFSVHFLAP